MKRAIHAFLQHLGRERNASAHTVRAYGQDLEQFAEHAREDLGRQGRPADVDHLLIRSFLARLHARGIKKASAARKLACLRTFFRYLCREGILDRNPARTILSPKTERRIPGHFDEGQMARFLDLPGGTPAALRNRAILELFYATGIRCSELVGLDLEDIDRDGRTARVLGKGQKERVVPFGKPAAAALLAYLAVRSGLSPRRGGVQPARWSIDDRSVSSYDRFNGLEQKASPHSATASRPISWSGARRPSGHPGVAGPLQLSTTQLHPRQHRHIMEIYSKFHPRPDRLLRPNARAARHRKQAWVRLTNNWWRLSRLVTSRPSTFW